MSQSSLTALARLRSHRFKLPSVRVFNGAGSAGPRRLAVTALIAVGTLAVIAVVVLGGKEAPVVSRDARVGQLDPLPGGLHTTPQLDALDQVSSDDEARAATKNGVSYTPRMAPSQLARPAPPTPEEPTISPSVILAQVAAGRSPHPSPRPTLPDFRTTSFPVEPESSPEITATPIAATSAEQQQAQQQAYSGQINDMFSHWGGRMPRTDVLMPPVDNDSLEAAGSPAGARPGLRTRSVAPDAPVAQPAAAQAYDGGGEILIPAGRGVYAHPILALSSDETSPVVMQADSGPIAGDRMIGTFSKEANRLIIHISTIVHHGENLSVDGVVTAPDTMEASVASKVDEHYVARFVLPAAAAFVAGLGQAIQQTSNSVSVLSPFGGATTSTNLNIRQQLGVAAGSAAAQLSNTLGQEAPKGPTISLEANVAVGVMFLSNVTARSGR